MFFTFWGLSVLKKKGANPGPKTIKERMFAMMTPSGSESLGTSKLNFFGAGAVLLRQMMKDKGSPRSKSSPRSRATSACG
jgi:peroxiredoxin family protein